MIRLVALALLLSSASAGTLEVGPGRRFDRIEAAVARARPGDTILVHARKGGSAYEKAAVYVRTPRLTIRGVGGRVLLSGEGYNYSGVGNIPRAIFQFQPSAHGCVLEGFVLTGARSESHNGAGVRINQANDVTVRACDIHGNDMGIMSNGNREGTAGRAQLIERCEIHHNGNLRRDGYNHNVYLGGAETTLRYCDIHHSIAGHNVKSRAHVTRIEYCFVHDSSNREFDLVDGLDTTRPGSDAHLVGNVIVKDPKCRGNRAVIHFGQDGGKAHVGTLHLRFNTIVTPFTAPILQLSSPTARARLSGNLVAGAGRTIAAPGAERIRGEGNWFSGRYQPGVLDTKANTFRELPRPLFENPAGNDYRPTAKTFRLLAARKPAGAPPHQYLHPRRGAPRPNKLPPVPGAIPTTIPTSIATRSR